MPRQSPPLFLERFTSEAERDFAEIAYLNRLIQWSVRRRTRVQLRIRERMRITRPNRSRSPALDDVRSDPPAQPPPQVDSAAEVATPQVTSSVQTSDSDNPQPSGQGNEQAPASAAPQVPSQEGVPAAEVVAPQDLPPVRPDFYKDDFMPGSELHELLQSHAAMDTPLGNDPAPSAEVPEEDSEGEEGATQEEWAIRRVIGLRWNYNRKLEALTEWDQSPDEATWHHTVPLDSPISCTVFLERARIELEAIILRGAVQDGPRI